MVKICTLKRIVFTLIVMIYYGFVILSIAAGKGALECHPIVTFDIQDQGAAVRSDNFPAQA